jgi:hypothetical protein
MRFLFSPCCARTGSAQVAVVQPTNAINSRRLMVAPIAEEIMVTNSPFEEGRERRFLGQKRPHAVQQKSLASSFTGIASPRMGRPQRGSHATTPSYEQHRCASQQIRWRCLSWVIFDRIRVASAARCLLFPESDLLTARQRNDAMGHIWPFGNFYSITTSARASRDSGIASPSVLAVLRFMTSINLVGCSTGISAGFAPRKILSTKSAAR